jgi:uncharacterized membrane-anchored protein YitT (DUF2179 family)
MRSLLKLFAICFGSLFIAVGINLFLVPFKVLDGGMIGIALISNYLWGTSIGLVILLSSLPLFFFAWRDHRDFVLDSIVGLFISCFMIDVISPLQYIFIYYIHLTPFTSSIFGGVLVGTGLGLMLRYKTSTGGTDLIAKVLSPWVRVNVGMLILFMDMCIIGIGGWLISMETFLYSICTILAGGIATSLLTTGKSH